MYLQPYNNPRAGLYGLHRKLHSSSLNLAASREPQVSYLPRVSDENSSGQEYPGPSGHQASVPARIHKAQSLDVLSEPWLPTQTEGEAPASTSDGRARSFSQDSTMSGFSDFSSNSDSSSSLKEVTQTGHSASTDLPDSSYSSGSLSGRRVSDTGSDSSGSVGSRTSKTAPRVPPRPKTEEILNRCTTMTRKAALTTKTRLQHQLESVHSRL